MQADAAPKEISARRSPRRILLLDGGTGSELRRRGARFDPKVWSAAVNLTQPELVAEVHRSFIAAGADAITANTFATNRFVLTHAGMERDFVAINRAAITAARLAAAPPPIARNGTRSAINADPAADAPADCDADAGAPRHEPWPRRVLVAASLSCLPPAFDTRLYPPPATEQAAYDELVALFVSNSVDVIAAEMLQDTEHAVRACKAATGSGLPVWIGLACRRDAESGKLVGYDRQDQPFTATLDAVLDFTPAAINLMHTPLNTIDEAVAQIRSRWAGPIGVYPELPYAEDPTRAEGVQAVTPVAFAKHAKRWLAAGVTIIGGCCGTTPAHIAALRGIVAAP